MVARVPADSRRSRRAVAPLLRAVHTLTGVRKSLQALCTSQINRATAARFGA